MNPKRHTWALICCIVLLGMMAAIDMQIGTAQADLHIMWMLRIPRIVTAILAGASLALAGVQMQGIFRNPLADPHIMGVSAGASLGAAAATMAAGGQAIDAGFSIAGAAILGAGAAALIILAASKKFRGASTLLIFGVMLGFIVNAIISILQFSSDAESLKIYYSWSAGSFSNSTWKQIMLIGISATIGLCTAIFNRKGLDIIMFGDEFAEMSGADTGRIRTISLISCCILTGAVTAFCGPLGFVGITAPHIARAILKTASHRIILPASIFTGAIIGLGADLLSQIAPSPIPVSSTMALIGIPVILYILIKKHSL